MAITKPLRVKGNFGECVIDDCRNWLPYLKDQYDLGITDPPWNIEWKGYQAYKKRETAIYYEDKGIPVESWFVDFQKHTKSQIVFPGTQNVCDYAKFNFQEIGGYYDKTGQFGSKIAVFKTYCPVLFWNIPFQTYVHSCIELVKFQQFIKGIIHPCPRPLSAIRYYCKPFTSVLDPFFGSGTVAQICEELGIHWKGFEKNSAYIPDIELRIKLGIEARSHNQFKKLGEY